MNRTTNYKLCQWEETDRVQRTDFNEDNVKIDAAIKAVDRRVDGLNTAKAEKAALTALQTAVNGKGNCRIETGSYVGDGDKHRTLSISTSFSPKLFFVMAFALGVAVRGSSTLRHINSVDRTTKVVWRDDGLSWKLETGSYDAGDIFNESNTTYHYVVLG